MAENYVLLETIRANISTASVTFDNLPTSGYTDLKILMSARSTRNNSTDSVGMTVNGSSSTYTNYRIYAFDANAGTSDNFTQVGYNVSPVPAAQTFANHFSNTEIYLTDYLSSSTKAASWMSAAPSASTVGNGLVLGNGLWSGTGAITSITLFTDSPSEFASGSTFYLCGLSTASTSTTKLAPKALGGNIVTNDATYWYHAFLNSGTFTAKELLSCDVLSIAGGGSGGGNLSGGGGAGGVVYLTSQSIAAGDHIVQVGAGAPINRVADGVQGSYSKFGSTTTAVGGGGGGSINGAFNAALLGGGSGGGGYATGGSGTAGQGNNGGSNSGSANSAAGGGGAGAAGSNGGGYGGGAGGAGTSTYSTWGLVTGTGVNSSGTVYYAGGGGGGGDGSQGGGGIGGGGAASANGVAGSTNTGGGGGGSYQTGSSRLGGAGGSGIVIVRYPKA
jgi:hypothetical protein